VARQVEDEEPVGDVGRADPLAVGRLRFLPSILASGWASPSASMITGALVSWASRRPRSSSAAAKARPPSLTFQAAKGRGADGARVGAGPLGLGALPGSRARARPRHDVEACLAQGLGGLVAPLALHGRDDGAVVGAGRQGFAELELEEAVQLLAPSVVVVEADGGAVVADPQVDAVLVLPTILAVHNGGVGAGLKPELGLEPVPVLAPLVIAPRAVGRGGAACTW